jgi:hypothetical protein
MSGAVTAIAAAVVVNEVMKPSKPAPAQPAQAPAPTQQAAAQQGPQPVVPAQAEQAAPDVANVLYRGMEGDNSRQAMSPQATRARRGGGASGATMLSGPQGVEGQSMSLSGGSTLLGS